MQTLLTCWKVFIGLYYGCGLISSSSAYCYPRRIIVNGDVRFKNSQFTASSSFVGGYFKLWPHHLKINGRHAWGAATRQTGEWLQVDLGAQYVVVMILLRPRHVSPRQPLRQYVTAFTMNFSRDGLNFITDNNNGKKYVGCRTFKCDKNSWTKRSLTKPIISRYVRMIVEGFHNWPATRFGVAVCWPFLRANYMDGSYYVFRNRTTYAGARQSCQMIGPGMDLAMWNTSDHQISQMLKALMASAGYRMSQAEAHCNPEQRTLQYWVGIHRPDSVDPECGKRCLGQWTWLDNTPITGQQNWDSQEIDISPSHKYVRASGCRGMDWLWLTSEGSQDEEYGYVCSRQIKQVLFKGTEYWSFSERVTFDQAREACKKIEGADLATPESKEVHDWMVKNLFPTTSNLYMSSQAQNCNPESITLRFWIGVTRPQGGCNSNDKNACRAGWEWVNSNAVTWSNWRSDQPLPSDSVVFASDCSRISYQWIGTVPRNTAGYICSRPVDEDECADDQKNTCVDAERCVNTYGSFTCVCDDGYFGGSCIEDVDECAVEAFCVHKESCTNSLGTYECTCSPGWTGPKCDEDINECEGASLCSNFNECVNTPGSFECACSVGWGGTFCDEDIDECVEKLCENEGTCSNVPGGYNCICPAEWLGLHCDADKNECLEDSLCQNGGECVNLIGDFNCICNRGWQGKTCDKDVDECKVEECLHSGTCANYDGSFSCVCQSGWTGQTCHYDIDECQDVNICQNNATCMNSNGTYNCTCSPGWQGTNCIYDIDECELAPPCVNQGTCANTVGSFICSCMSGWEGRTCVDDIDECQNQYICQNEGTCSNAPGSYSCACTPAWKGENCELDYDACLELQPCPATATCVSLEDAHHECLCPAGWRGDTCTEDVDECRTSPCLHLGSCSNTQGSFTCSCEPTWTGATCSEDVDECTTLTPCLNSGTCYNAPGYYNCSCVTGWTGVDCADEVTTPYEAQTILKVSETTESDDDIIPTTEETTGEPDWGHVTVKAIKGSAFTSSQYILLGIIGSLAFTILLCALFSGFGLSRFKQTVGEIEQEEEQEEDFVKAMSASFQKRAKRKMTMLLNPFQAAKLLEDEDTEEEKPKEDVEQHNVENGSVAESEGSVETGSSVGAESRKHTVMSVGGQSRKSTAPSVGGQSRKSTAPSVGEESRRSTVASMGAESRRGTVTSVGGGSRRGTVTSVEEQTRKDTVTSVGRPSRKDTEIPEAEEPATDETQVAPQQPSIDGDQQFYQCCRFM